MRGVAVAVLLASTAALGAGKTTKVLVGTTPTRMPAATLFSRRVLTIQNLNGQPIWCAHNEAEAVVGEAFRLDYKDTFSVSANTTSSFSLWCVAEAAQTSETGYTVCMELQ